MSNECGRNEGAAWRKVKIRDCTVFLLKTSHPAPWSWSSKYCLVCKVMTLMFLWAVICHSMKTWDHNMQKTRQKNNALPWCWCFKACLWWYMYFGRNHLKTRTRRCCSHPALSREKDVFTVLQIGLGKSLIYHILALLTGKAQLLYNSIFFI